MERTEIYLDNSATTRVYPEVASLMCKIMTEDYGNPSSMHSNGVEAEKYVLDAYKQVAEVLKVKEKESSLLQAEQSLTILL